MICVLCRKQHHQHPKTRQSSKKERNYCKLFIFFPAKHFNFDGSVLFLRCYHGPLLYEAKCVKIKLDSSSNYSYFVHYQGWNKNWDEWVNDTRILKVVAENLELKDKLLKDHTASVRDKKKASKTTGGGPLGTPFPKDGGKKSSGGSANTSRASTPVR